MIPPLSVRVRPFSDGSGKATKLLAFAELIIADAFIIKGIRVMKRECEADEEAFIVFPAEKGKGVAGDRWFDVAYPVTAEARVAATTAILAAYRAMPKMKEA